MSGTDDSGIVSAQRLLFVDDDDLMRTSFARALARLGYEVDTACSAVDAVAQVQARNYPLVVTDLHMPGDDGLALIDQVRALRPATAFILVTGDDGADLQWSERLDGAIASVLSKPLDLDDLAKTIEHALAFQEVRTAVMTGTVPSLPPNVPVLLVEDNSADSDFVEDLLLSRPVTVVRRLSDALRIASDGPVPFGAIITDLTLPDARGLDAVVRLRARAPDAALLVMTGLDDDALAQQVIQLGAQEFLIKASLNKRVLMRALACAIERKRTEKRLVQLAHYDQLTGLMNRTNFHEQLNRAVTRARRQRIRLAVLLIDIDGFKAVNDAFGHDVGDTLLQEISHRMRRQVREYDLLARLGGDEFAVALTALDDVESASAVAGRLVDAIGEPYSISGHAVTVTASVGIALFPDSAEAIADLLKRADMAMYEAKGAGKNQHRSACISAPPPRLSSWPPSHAASPEVLVSQRVPKQDGAEPEAGVDTGR